VLTSLDSSKQRVDVALKSAHVASICFKCFRGMLQVFHMDVCNGYTHMLQASVLNVSFVFSDVCLQVCLSGYCICFTHMLHVFYLDVAYILK
jgi:hypothetical protein